MKSDKARLSDADGKIPGGNYTAVANEDGTYNVLDVPIFGELPAGAKGNEEPIGKAWLQAAVEKAGKLRDGKYWAPLHTNHHDSGAKTERAGTFFPKRVGQLNYLGKEIWAVFADLLNVPAKVYQKIKAGELPYRSVEVARWTNAEISSCALLEDEAPFFRFEMLTIGRELKQRPTEAIRFERGQTAVPAMAMFSAGKGAVALFKFDGGDEVAKAKAAAKLAEAEKDEHEKKEEKEGTKESGEKLADDTIQKVHPVYMKCLKILHRNLMDMSKRTGHPVFDMDFEGFEGKMDGMEATDAEAPPEKEKTTGYKPVDQPKDERSKLSEETMSEELKIKMAEQAGEIAALKAGATAREHKDKVTALVAAAEKKLSGWHIDDDVRAEMLKFAEADDSGKLLDAFTGRYQKSVPKDPPRKGDAAGLPAEKQDAPEIAKFAASSPEDLEKVRKLSEDYDLSIAHGIPISMSRERFLEVNMKIAPVLKTGANGR